MVYYYCCKEVNMKKHCLFYISLTVVCILCFVAIITLSGYKISAKECPLYKSPSDRQTYIIYTPEDLGQISKYPNNNYILGCDIDFGHQIFTPLCDESSPFQGCFDGNHHNITNFKAVSSNKTSGIFSYIGEKGIVKNLNIQDNITTVSSAYCGNICSINKGKISCCFNLSDITINQGACYCGGICGVNHGDIENCYNICDFINYSTDCVVGGICGKNDGGKISCCYSISNFNACKIKGGICGDGNSVNCFFNAKMRLFENGMDSNSNFGISLSDLRNKSTYENWDFDNIWEIQDSKSNGYPTLKVQDTSALLKNISIDNQKLSPEFDENIFEYSLILSSYKSSCNVKADKKSPYSKISVNSADSNGDSLIPLESGSNQISITVTSIFGDTKTYKINITNPPPKHLSSNSSLCLLELEGENFNSSFSKDIYEYNCQVEHSQSEVIVDALCEDSLAHVFINGENTNKATIDFNSDNKEISLVVEAEDGTNTVYTVHLTRRAEVLSDNNYLLSLSVSEGNLSPDFVKTTTNYDVTVENSITSMQINAYSESDSAKILFNNSNNSSLNLAEGKNEVSINVIAEDGSNRIYTITVTRKALELPLLSLIDCKNFNISPVFSPTVFNYSSSVDSKTDKLNFEVTPKDSSYKVNIDNYDSKTSENQLVYGDNTIKITVSDKSGNLTTYTIKVKREYPKVNKLYSLSGDNFEINEDFSPDIYTYTANVPYSTSKIKISAFAKDSFCNILVNSKPIQSDISLNIGKQKISIDVISPQGLKTEYSINVTREEPTSANLKSLSLEGVDFEENFNSNIYFYKASCDNSKDKIKINFKAFDESSKIVINNSPQNYNTSDTTLDLNIGSNIIKIDVTSKDGDKKSYSINLTRTDYDDYLLKYLSLSSGTLSPDFSPLTIEYSAKVDKTTDSINVNAIPVNQSATITVNDKDINRTIPLNYGNNEIVVRVKTSEGSCCYKINLFRDYDFDAKLESLEVSSGNLSPKFDKDIYHYSVTERSTTLIKISAKAFSPSATVKINGISANDKEEVPIHVFGYDPTINIDVSESGTTSHYKIDVIFDIDDDGNGGLKEIVIDDNSVISNITKENTFYFANVSHEKSKVRIYPVKSSTDVVLEYNSKEIPVNGFELDLLPGKNYAVINTYYNGKRKDYCVCVSRDYGGEPDNRDDVNLENLACEDYQFSSPFSNSSHSYQLSVPLNTESVTLSAFSGSSGKIITQNGEIIQSGQRSKIPLSNGTTYIVYQIKNGEHTGYYLITVKKSTDYIEKGLSSLVLSDGALSPQFSKNTTHYSTTVEYGVSKVTINAKTENPNDIITYNGSNSGYISLLVGSNIVNTKIVHTDGSEETYTVEITRKFNQKFSIDYCNSVGYYCQEIPDSVLHMNNTDALSLELKDDTFILPCDNLKKDKSQAPLIFKEKRTEPINLKTASFLAKPDVTLLDGLNAYLVSGNQSYSQIGSTVNYHLTSDVKASLKNGVPQVYFYDKTNSKLILIDSSFDIYSSVAIFKANLSGTYLIGVKLSSDSLNYNLTTDKFYTNSNQGKSFNCIIQKNANNMRCDSLYLVVQNYYYDGHYDIKQYALNGESENIDISVSNNILRSTCYLIKGSFQGENKNQKLSPVRSVS